MAGVRGFDLIEDVDGDVIEVGAAQDVEVLRIGEREVHLDAKGRERFNKAHAKAGRRAGNEAVAAVPPAFRVKITVTGDCGHVLWEGFDKVEEKYPFWCDECDDDRREGKYPWTLATEIVAAEPEPDPDYCGTPKCNHLVSEHTVNWRDGDADKRGCMWDDCRCMDFRSAAEPEPEPDKAAS